MREIRDRISAEIAGLSYEELRQWLDARVQQDLACGHHGG